MLRLNKILIIKMSSLGDLFHALPTVHNLKQLTGASIDWVTQPEYTELVGCFNDVTRVIPFPRRHLWSKSLEFLRALRQERYDYIIDLQGLLKSAVVGLGARGGKTIGPSYNREGSKYLYSAVAGQKNKERHAVDEALDVVRYLGLEVLPPAFPVSFPTCVIAEKHPRIALVPCSRWPTKNWPAERFIELGQRLQKQLAASLFIVGGKADQATCNQIQAGLTDKAINTCGKSSLVELGSLLQEMDLVITVDSGPMHMAAALNRPVLAIFGSTNPLRTGPYGHGHRVITKPGLPCRPCYSRECLSGARRCLLEINADVIVENALEMLGH